MMLHSMEVDNHSFYKNDQCQRSLWSQLQIVTSPEDIKRCAFNDRKGLFFQLSVLSLEDYSLLLKCFLV